MRAFLWVSYNGKAGIWRILDILHEQGVRASFGVSGLSAELFPEATKAIHQEGHELMAHSYAENIASYQLSREEERANIKRCVEILETIGGQRPVGWLSMGAHPSDNTYELLAEEGFLYHSDCADDDLPYIQQFGDRRIVAVPYLGHELNDLLFLRHGLTPDDYVQMFKRGFEIAYESGEQWPILFNASFHARIFGRPVGAWALREIIRHVKGFPRVWIATRREVAEWWLARYG